MKPNGMRAWRRLARMWRRKQNRHNRETGAPWIADGTGRWYRRQQAFFKQRPTVHAPAFCTWSLVGMTMGARKRAWVAGKFDRLLYPYGITTDALEMESACSWSEIRHARPFLGQRLRPCPNPFCSKEDGCALRQCHGSGVLPARRP